MRDGSQRMRIRPITADYNRDESMAGVICNHGIPRTIIGPIQRVKSTGSRCQTRIIRS